MSNIKNTEVIKENFSIDNLESMKVAELKEIIKTNGMDIKVSKLKKAELISAIQEQLSNTEGVTDKATQVAEVEEVIVSYEEAAAKLDEFVGNDFFTPQKITKEWLDLTCEALESFIDEEKYEDIPTFIFLEWVNFYAKKLITKDELVLGLDFLSTKKNFFISSITETKDYIKTQKEMI